MSAVLIENLKLTLDNGAIVQIKVWRLSHATRNVPRAEVLAVLWASR